MKLVKVNINWYYNKVILFIWKFYINIFLGILEISFDNDVVIRKTISILITCII